MESAEAVGFSVHSMELEPRARHAEVGKVIVEANLLLAQADPTPETEFAELISLNRVQLDAHPIFAYLKNRLELYYEEKQSRSDYLHPEKSRKWKDALYSSLLKALMELTFTSDKQLQERYLQRISHWYGEKTQTQLPDVRPRSRTIVPARKPAVSCLNTVAVSQRSRLDRMQVRKMDAVQTIEARSMSPVRSISPLPKLPMRIKAFQSYRAPPFNDSAVAEKLAFLQARRQQASHSKAHHSFLMKRWGSARSRLDEVLAQRGEMKDVKVRVASASESDEEEVSSPIEPISAPMPITLSFVDKADSELDPPQDRTQSRIERLRYAYRNLLPKSMERMDSPDRASMSVYSAYKPKEVRTPSPIDLAKSPLPDGSVQKAELQSLRKRLARSNVACNYEVLNSGLNRPADLPKDHLSHLFLPSGGEYFTPNPFSSLGKKKKKKGKKKKKA